MISILPDGVENASSSLFRYRAFSLSRTIPVEVKSSSDTPVPFNW